MFIRNDLITYFPWMIQDNLYFKYGMVYKKNQTIKYTTVKFLTH